MPNSSVVTCDDLQITCQRSSGLVEQVAWEALQAVFIQTTADGPFSDDVFWVLVGQTNGCVVPSEAQGVDEMLARLQQLPGFDNEAVITAMSCTEEQRFLCWRKI
jgi:hypothetical protein